MSVQSSGGDSTRRKLVPPRIAAEAVGVHPRTLNRWADEGLIPVFRINSRVRRFNLDAVLAALAASSTAITSLVGVGSAQTGEGK